MWRQAAVSVAGDLRNRDVRPFHRSEPFHSLPRLVTYNLSSIALPNIAVIHHATLHYSLNKC